MNDTNKHQGLRNQLVKVLEEKGISDTNVLAAIGKIPRHLFLDSSFENFAYQDKAFPIGSDQTISQPYTVAYQSQLLEIKKGDKILEIGTGSGYQTAVLCFLGAVVYTVNVRTNYLKIPYASCQNWVIIRRKWFSVTVIKDCLRPHHLIVL